jgi:putative mRNA 3-end processing factor
MSNEILVDVTKNGAVILGPDVVCDGFLINRKYRIQSHIHSDHMDDFDTSKGIQTILLSPGTYELLKIIKNADINYRGNICTLKCGKKNHFGDSEVLLLSSGHMLGSVQSQVTLDNGLKLGYSGDFYWPIQNVIKADILVVDATYGNPESVRYYDQNEVHSQFVALLQKKFRSKSIKIRAHRGTLECALDILSSHDINIPIIADESTHSITSVHHLFGFNCPPIYSINSKEGKKIMNNGKYIYICNPRKDNPSIRDEDFVIINLSAYMVGKKEPILKINNSTYKVALTRHADFNGTMKYIEKTGATKVVTDNARGPYAIDLAIEIETRLGIEACPSTCSITDEWCEN